MNIARFGTFENHKINLFRLEGKDGFYAEVLNYGGRVKTISVPGRNGKADDIVLGFDSLDSYLSDTSCLGAICGRYANRIKNGTFSLDQELFHVSRNEGNNCLHGGFSGFNCKVWQAEPIDSGKNQGVRLTLVSPDMEEGFPGELHVSVTYRVTPANEFIIDYEATTDRPTVLNLTNHCYYNFSGASRDVLEHQVLINADSVTEIDKELIPTGRILPVAGTRFDFRTIRPVKMPEETPFAGYDDNFVLKPHHFQDRIAMLYEPSSGRKMEIYTTEPGVQVYTAGHFNGSITGKQGILYQRFYGICFETQHFPDSPNHPEFPSTRLNPGQKYHQTTMFRFSVED